jgi:hypothetical protein
LFTIIFGTTVATLVKRYALWKAQEGATIAKLEQYQASTSLPSTVKTIITLRSWTFTSVGLVMVWSFYYLGSQAVQREYTYQISSHAEDTRVFFRSAQASSFFGKSSDLASDSTTKVLGLSVVNSILMSSVVGAVTYVSFGSDTYNEPVVPFMNQTTDTQFGSPDGQGWQKIDVNYYGSSYLGVPIYWASEEMSTSLFLGTCSNNLIHLR